MAKKKEPGENKKNKKKQKIRELSRVDNVPKFNKLPTNAAPTAKCSSSSSSPASPSALGLSVPYDRDEASTATLTSFDDKKDGRKKLHDKVDCSRPCDEIPGFVLNFSEDPSVEVESVALNKVSGPCSGKIFHKKVVEKKSDKKKLQVRGSNGICITPGNVVWAKTDCHVWWAAEIIGKRSSLADSKNQHTEEGILVKFYGKNKSAWVDAARDLSLLKDCFEERSCNPVENFQDALKQALVQRRKHLKSCQKLPGSPDLSNHSGQQDEKSGKWSSSTSSKTGSNSVKQGGIKKERKPTIQPDDVTFPSKSAKGARRLKIMRYLGLTAPRGSPFKVVTHVKIA